MKRKSSVSKILVPIEFSDRCRGAARYAEALACHFNAELVLLHVVATPYFAYGSAGQPSHYSSSADIVAEKLSQCKTEVDAFLHVMPIGLCARGTVREGDPASEIVAYAHAEKFDLIVMPTHGYGRFRRFLLGSVTAKVLHDADCPVWTGPHMEEAPCLESIRFRTVACAVDLGPQCGAVIAWAAGFAEEFAANLAVLHVIPASTASLGSYYFDPSWRHELGKAAQQQISYLMQDIGAQGEVHIDIGDVPSAVSNAVERIHSDLLVIGRGHGSGVIGKLKTNAYAILRESPCPVASI